MIPSKVTDDLCVGFSSEPNYHNAIFVKQNQLKVKIEEIINLLVKSDLYAQENGLSRDPIRVSHKYLDSTQEKGIRKLTQRMYQKYLKLFLTSNL